MGQVTLTLADRAQSEPVHVAFMQVLAGGTHKTTRGDRHQAVDALLTALHELDDIAD